MGITRGLMDRESVEKGGGGSNSALIVHLNKLLITLGRHTLFNPQFQFKRLEGETAVEVKSHGAYGECSGGVQCDGVWGGLPRKTSYTSEGQGVGDRRKERIRRKGNWTQRIHEARFGCFQIHYADTFTRRGLSNSKVMAWKQWRTVAKKG